MPKHTRHQSGSRGHYADQLPVSLANSSMYNPQRMAMPANYYALASSAAPAGMSLPGQEDAQQAAYESYPATEPVAIPPSQHRPSSGAWTPQDDQQLLTARMQGLNWGQIREMYFPTKTPNACRKRHERLMERKGADDWDNRKMQRMAKEYMGMRKEIWSGLAARTGEKWNVVEQKCMSNGLKNLQSAARAASRRDRLETGVSSIPGYDDDSGISGIGLTPVDELDPSYSSPATSSSGGHSFSSGSASVSNGYHLHPHAAHTIHGLPNHGPGSYAVNNAYIAANAAGAYVPGQHRYSSSVSSNASAGGYGGHSQGNSPYMQAQRLSSTEMGIDSLINRSSGGRV